MPLFWKYILKSFSKVFSLSVFGFSFLLLLTRSKEIAKYASIASTFKDVVYFMLIQIPHVLPLAIPLSCFISAFITIRNLSLTSEITALRTASLSIAQILIPILLGAVLLAFVNFYICAELTPKLRYKSQDFLIEKTSTNPVNLLKKHKLLKIKDSFVNFKNIEDNQLNNLIFVTYHPSSKKLLILTAKKLTITKQNLNGVSTTLVSSLKTTDDQFDHLIIENQLQLSSPSLEIALMMKKNKRKLLHTFSSLKHLKMQKKDIKTSKIYYSELYRRISLSIYVFLFAFVGASYGLSIQRNVQKKSFFTAILLLGIILTSYLTAKHLRMNPGYALTVYLSPIIYVTYLCVINIKKISKGVD